MATLDPIFRAKTASLQVDSIIDIVGIVSLLTLPGILSVCVTVSQMLGLTSNGKRRSRVRVDVRWACRALFLSVCANAIAFLSGWHMLDSLGDVECRSMRREIEWIQKNVDVLRPVWLTLNTLYLLSVVAFFRVRWPYLLLTYSIVTLLVGFVYVAISVFQSMHCEAPYLATYDLFLAFNVHALTCMLLLHRKPRAKMSTLPAIIELTDNAQYTQRKGFTTVSTTYDKWFANPIRLS